jgi:hypothetical protein
MGTVHQQIISANQVICHSIESLSDQRGLLSQNILAQLRNLVEGIAVYFHHRDPNTNFHWDNVNPALTFVSSRGKYKVLSRFHQLIQKSASHYTLDGDNSERLMLKYYEFLYRTRSLVYQELGVSILANLETFPIDLDPSLREYHQKIAERINSGALANSKPVRERYYIHKTKPFFDNGQVYYEVTFYPAVNTINKFDRIIGFTNIDISEQYSAMLTIQRDSIQILGFKMPITVISNWDVSIRPCEFNNFAKLFGTRLDIKSNSHEYIYLMECLTHRFDNLLDIIDMHETVYTEFKNVATHGISSVKIFSVLEEARQIIKSNYNGSNVLRYLLLRMNNKIIKSQLFNEQCGSLSNLRLKYGCIPFDNMPFCTSLPGHNPRFRDLVESLGVSERHHEILARRVKNNVEQEGVLYTLDAELEDLGNVAQLIQTYNRKVYYKHTNRHLLADKGHVFLKGYEDDTIAIINDLQHTSSLGIDGYEPFVNKWLDETPANIDDPTKKNALKTLFSESGVALIYGAAGTGKSTMLSHIAHLFSDKSKLFLAHTNPATDNLKRKVSAINSQFRTIRSHLSRRDTETEYDLIIIDECSTVSNSDLLNVLQRTSFKLLVLVGDVYQIESIRFGNWFEVIRSFIPQSAVFELNTPFRTTNKELLLFWNKVRENKDDIAEVIARNSYSEVLGAALFQAMSQDEVILCLNYDGLYGINNVNRFLQASNSNPEVTWRAASYKVGDPVLFTDTDRFRPVIYNNLKGWIMNIEKDRAWIKFDIKLDRPLNELDVRECPELDWMGDSTVRLTVFDYAPSSSDEDDDSSSNIVPFQVAYAVSIHKAQGLEYDSVKIVITDANEDDISHCIFYTAITRTRNQLKIFWTPETQQSVLKKLTNKTSSKDVHLIRSRHINNA